MPLGSERAGVRGLRAGRLDVLVEQILEFGPLLLEAGGVHVRQIVGDDFDIGLLGQHAGRGDGKSAHGLISLTVGIWPSLSIAWRIRSSWDWVSVAVA